MQPGSSSHSAGPCRLGFLAADLLGERPARVHILLDARGSFAGTFGVMAEDRAMVARALGLLPADRRLFEAFSLAEQLGMEVAFEFGELRESAHPSAISFELTGRSGKRVTLVGNSTGGGMVETVAVDGFPLRTKGDSFVALLVVANDRVRPGWRVELAAALPGLLQIDESSVVGRGRRGDRLQAHGADR